MPQQGTRTSGIAPNIYWDKSSYVLGVSLTSKRFKEEHDAFVKLHLELLKESDDLGLQALSTFLNSWESESFESNPLLQPLSETLIDSNLVFRLDGDLCYLHEREAAKNIRDKLLLGTSETQQSICLVSGLPAKIERIHTNIKNVNGAQTAGASIVSFNKNAFESYGKEQGANAPVSEQATFAYTTALNYLLRRDVSNRQRLQLGDATVVFWAEAKSQVSVDAGEDLFAAFIDPEAKDEQEAEKLKRALDAVRQGRPLTDLNKELTDDIQIYILGLAPNAARLSIRYWQADSLQVFAKRLAQHYEDLRIEPLPWRTPPAIWRLLQETAPYYFNKKLNKKEPKEDRISPMLAGEVTRAVLTGNAYPYSLVSNLLMRFRADGQVTGLRVALIKAAITRLARLTNTSNSKGEMPVSLDTTNRQPGYLLGRLFSTLEKIQQDALGGDVSATIRDRYYGAASATPAHIFPVLLRNTQNHLAKVRKDKPGLAVNREKILGEVIDNLESDFPKSLRIEAQGQFALGYYQQKQAFFTKKETSEVENLIEDKK
ncbi:type I-C CRISPR-associated protein Cas8c/Csd1 [Oceanisphaera marina]|uniref:Type I-C CRISPR-associated protein Cas8c/Csd1 n=1 Tax=Oceanisphaera marina TaxID=2017550 RepID=A0ABQ1J0C8_9GAMM|nr:type I-C CRISPR-associated protein Cas8c/Csd1 [Oceanisphaera marina]